MTWYTLCTVRYPFTNPTHSSSPAQSTRRRSSRPAIAKLHPRPSGASSAQPNNTLRTRTISCKPQNTNLATLSEHGTHHLQSPHSPYPNFQLSLHAVHVVELHTLPPAPARGFPPEEQQLLCHADGVAVRRLATDVGSQPGERDRADDGFIRFGGAVAPDVGVVEATLYIVSGMKRVIGEADGRGRSYPAVSISIRCCSVVPGSSLLRSPEKMPSCRRRALPAARLTSIISVCSISLRGGIA